MLSTRKRIEMAVSQVAINYPPPAGYRWKLESDGGYGTPRLYKIAVVRADFQGGDFLNFPTLGGLPARDMLVYLRGLNAGVDMKDRLVRLPVVFPKIKREVRA